MHHDGRIGQRAQLHRAAAMIGVRVSVDDQVEAQSMISEDRKVSLDLVANWIDDGGLAGRFRDRQVSLALAMIEFAKDHFLLASLPLALDRAFTFRVQVR
jgi:hypothetical protein